MTSGSDKWIRSLKDNPAGKVVPKPNGGRWEWRPDPNAETARLSRKLQTEELEIEHSAVAARDPRGGAGVDPRGERARDRTMSKRAQKRDEGGGFDPYDNPGKPGR